MKSLADVFRALHEMLTAGVIRNYAIGGAMATLFYAEPTRTYDLDVFVILPDTTRSRASTSGHGQVGFPSKRNMS